DVVVLAGEEYFDYSGQEIMEFSINAGHPWIGLRIVDLRLDDKKLILSIDRNGKFINADGNTVIKEEDRILLITDENMDFSIRG
ncbi:MAG: TrkA C-terminal domain-containing protein, partial [Peptoniphilus sp.]|nr:TrkA C-terminal domain-containing protein [Peptoniphilus sp.]